MPIDYDRIADLYDVYVRADDDVAFFVAEASKVDGPVLELAAGTGRLSIPLLRVGARLTCVDRSPRMLDVLARKAAEQALRLDIRCADLCELEFDAAFALVLLPFNAFMEIVGEEHQRRALSVAFDALVPGGRFVCTLHNPRVRRRQIDGALRAVGRFPVADGELVVSGIERGGNRIVSRVQIFERLDTEGAPRWKRSLAMKFVLVEREAFESMARDTGFRVLELYGDYERSPFEPERSAAMVWVLERPSVG